MPQPANPDRRPVPQLTPKVLGVAAATGLLILLGAWWMGPSLFGSSSGPERVFTDATVTSPSDCSDADAQETVRFDLGGRTREGRLSGCGHDQDEQVRIAVAQDATSSGSPVPVALAATAPGVSDLRRPVGLGLLVLSCASGGAYAFLLARGPRPGLVRPSAA